MLIKFTKLKLSILIWHIILNIASPRGGASEAVWNHFYPRSKSISPPPPSHGHPRRYEVKTVKSLHLK